MTRRCSTLQGCGQGGSLVTVRNPQFSAFLSGRRSQRAQSVLPLAWYKYGSSPEQRRAWKPGKPLESFAGRRRYLSHEPRRKLASPPIRSCRSSGGRGSTARLRDPGWWRRCWGNVWAKRTIWGAVAVGTLFAAREGERKPSSLLAPLPRPDKLRCPRLVSRAPLVNQSTKGIHWARTLLALRVRLPPLVEQELTLRLGRR